MSHPDIVPEKHLAASIAVALKLAKLRPQRNPLESDEICARAAEAVVDSFRRAGWQVIRTEQYRGWGPEGSGHFMRGRPPGRCESCDD